jgi:hypothetical protein
LHRNPDLRGTLLDPELATPAHHLLAGFGIAHRKVALHRATSQHEHNETNHQRPQYGGFSWSLGLAGTVAASPLAHFGKQGAGM